MKYFGEPGLTIVDYKHLKKVFTFDENGEYETADPKVVDWMKKNKNFIRCEEPVEIEEKVTEEVTPQEEVKPKHKCKKCDFVGATKGELLAHYRKEHKKEAEKNG